MMADSKIVFGMCLLSVAFVALGSAQETDDAAVNDDGTATTWCAGFQKGIDATEDVDDDLIFAEDELVGAKLFCDVIPDCLGVKKNQDGSFTPRMVTEAKPNMLTEGIATSWLNKNKCLPGTCFKDHPFAYDAGRQCCSTARGDGYDSQTNNWVVQDWTTRRQAWDSTSCEGDSVYCHVQPGSEGYDETLVTYPCENLKVECEADSDCADKDEGYGKCDTMKGVCTTMCTDKEFQCEVSKMCIDKFMKCNDVPDCSQWYQWSWEDSSDEDTCDTTS